MKAASLSFTSRIRRSCGDCRSQLTLLLCLTAVLAAAAPAWWSQQGLLTPDGAKDDYTVVNIGQLKHTAKKAAQAIETQHGAGSMGVEIQTMISGWDAALADTIIGDDQLAVNVGMLKNVAAPFYDRLRVLGNDPARFPYAYPWSVVRKSGGSTVSGSDLVNIASTSGLETGMLVHGSGIPTGTTIAQFVNATQIRLSAPATQSGTGMVVAFARPGVGQRREDVSLAVDSDVLTTSSTAGLAVGMMVLGPGLPASTRILAINSMGQIQLSQPSTLTLTGAYCYFYPMDDHAMVNLGQLKNVFSFYAASLGDPVPLTFPISQSTNPAYYEAKQRWDALPAYASFLTESRPQGSSATDLDGDGIPNDQEYWMSLLPGGRPTSYFDANDIDGDRILDSELINGLPLAHTEDHWNGTAPPTSDTVSVLNKRNPSDAAADFFRFDYPSDGVMNYEEIKLGLSPLISTTLILADGRTRTDTADVHNDTKVLAWGLLHGSASLSPSVDAIAYCWNKLIALGASGRESWFAENGIVRQPGWLVTTDGTDAGSTPDGLDAFRLEAPVLLATRLTLPTNWTITDHDGDGMSDRWEYRYGLDPRSAKDKNLDPDNDGLTNSQEFNSGTIGNSGGSNPFLVDTDGDGYTDKGEKDAGTNPTLTTAPSQMPLKMAKITSTLPSRFIGMPSDAMIVQVHKGGIPQPAVPVTFNVTSSVPSSWGLMASASGGSSNTGSMIVRTDSNGLASVTFTGAKTGSVQIRATAPTGITPTTQFFNVTIEAMPSYISSISGNYVNHGGGEDGFMFSQARNLGEAESQHSPASNANDFGLRIQKGNVLSNDYKKKKKEQFNGGIVALDQFPLGEKEGGWHYLEHSYITYQKPTKSTPLSSNESQAKQRTFIIVRYDSDTELSPNAAQWSGSGPTPTGITAEVTGTITFKVDKEGNVEGAPKEFTPGKAEKGKAFSIHLLPVELKLTGVTDDSSDKNIIIINADNDNGSSWQNDTNNTIPQTRDYAHAGNVSAEDELQEVTLTVPSGVQGITPEVKISKSGHVKAWTNANKTQEITIGGDGKLAFPGGTYPSKFYLEGIKLNDARGEMNISLAVAQGSTRTEVKQVKFAVGPVFTSMSVGRIASSGFAVGIGPDGNAHFAPGDPGALIKASVYAGVRYSEGVRFIQNVLGSVRVQTYTGLKKTPPVVTRTLNGTVGNQSFPFLDAQDRNATSLTLFYQNDFQVDAAKEVFSVTDSPSFPAKPINDAGTLKLDGLAVSDLFQMYSVYRYSDGSILPLGSVVWTWIGGVTTSFDDQNQNQQEDPGERSLNVDASTEIKQSGSAIKSNVAPQRLKPPVALELGTFTRSE